VTPQMRRDYYEQHRTQFHSIPVVRYARFVRMNQAAAESLVARLNSGEPAFEIMAADSLLGDDSTGTIRDMKRSEHEEYEKLLFEELRPGQTAKIGPDREGKYLVFQLLEFHPERQMSFQEVVGIVDESVQNIESERILKEFLARRRPLYRIEMQPEVVMHIRLTDPSNDSPQDP
jgi:hypothetical protein